jgi:hypothetical protein
MKAAHMSRLSFAFIRQRLQNFGVFKNHGNNLWYKTVLAKHAKEIALAAISSIASFLAILVWHYHFNHSFVWYPINPIEHLDIFIRFFYSAHVFVTIGTLLYYLGFYKALTDIVLNN